MSSGDNIKKTRASSRGTNLTNDNHSQIVLKSCLKACTNFGWQDETMRDLVLIAGTVRIPVHKTAMISYSSYFQAMMKDTWKENTNTEVALEAVDSVGLRTVVDFIYTGDVTLNNDNVKAVIQAASYLQVSSLSDVCEKYCLSITTTENCVDILMLTEMCSFNNTIINFIAENFIRISKEQYVCLSARQLSTLFAMDNLNITSEIELVEVLRSWMEANESVDIELYQGAFDVEETTWKTFGDLAMNIRWCLIMTDNVSKNLSDILKQVPPCLDVWNDAIDYHSDQLKQPFKQSIHSQLRRAEPSVVTFSSTCDSVCNVFNIEKKTAKCMDKCPVSENDTKVDISHANMVAVNNFLYVCGISTDDKMCFYRYDPRFNSWLTLCPMSIQRECESYVLLSHGKKLYVIGGEKFRAEPAEPMSLCEAYDVESDKWNPISEYPIPIDEHAGCVMGDTIYISGGYDGNNEESSSMYKYDVDTGTWQQCSNMKYARFLHSMEILGDAIYVIGGCGIHNETVHFHTEKYSAITDQWTDCTPELNVYTGLPGEDVDVLDIAGSCVYNGRIYITQSVYVEPRSGRNYTMMIVYEFVKDSDNVIVNKVKINYDILHRACAFMRLPAI